MTKSSMSREDQIAAMEAQPGYHGKAPDPLADVKAEASANAAVAAEDKSAETKCDNHPGRQGRNFTGGGSYNINLCDECTPPWFLESE